MADETKKATQPPKENQEKEYQPFEKIDFTAGLALVVEDSFPNRNILKGILNSLGFEVVVASNGEEALKALTFIEANKGNLEIVISDIMMPKMDGLQFLQTFRQFPQYQTNPPFIFVTAATDRQNVIEAGKFGANVYLIKPVTLAQVKEKLAKLLPDRKFSPRRRKVS